MRYQVPAVPGNHLFSAVLSLLHQHCPIYSTILEHPGKSPLLWCRENNIILVDDTWYDSAKVPSSRALVPLHGKLETGQEYNKTFSSRCTDESIAVEDLDSLHSELLAMQANTQGYVATAQGFAPVARPLMILCNYLFLSQSDPASRVRARGVRCLAGQERLSEVI